MNNKYIALAFDDGGKDQFTNAVRIMRKYGLTGSIYVTTGFVDGTLENGVVKSAGGHAMSVEDILSCLSYEIEIGAHSNRHTNEIEDIECSLKKLTIWCGDKIKKDYQFGFASPSSELYDKNIHKLDSIRNKLQYVRTSVQIKRNGRLYCVLYLLNKILKNKNLFYFLNKRYINLSDPDIFLMKSVAIKKDTPVEHVKYFVQKLKNNECAIFLFHSILENEQKNQKVDCWWYDIRDFEDVCQFLAEYDCEVITVSQAFLILRQKEI